MIGVLILLFAVFVCASLFFLALLEGLRLFVSCMANDGLWRSHQNLAVLYLFLMFVVLVSGIVSIAIFG